MLTKRTDLAVEAREIWNESAEDKTKLSGVQAEEEVRNGCRITRVNILDGEGEKALGKPRGKYVTIEMEGFARRDAESFPNVVKAARDELAKLLPLREGQHVLIVGLGNRDITPDAVGPLAIGEVMVTRHLVSRVPEHFGHMRPVSAITPGVLGTTGMESQDIIKGVIQNTTPDAVIIIDALASRKLSRVCTTIQLADTGIIPGSGVGNTRAALNQKTLGVPVVAVGVPTVVDVGTLVADLSEEAGIQSIDPEILRPFGGEMIVTPKEIDTHVSDIARVVGYAINICLHPDLSIEDVTAYLS